MPLKMQPLSDKFGVAITGVDLSKELDEKLFNEIVDVFVKKQVLVFRDQHIEPQHQVAFSKRFGRSKCCLTRISGCRGFPEIAILSNEKVDGKFIGVVAAGDFEGAIGLDMTTFINLSRIIYCRDQDRSFWTYRVALEPLKRLAAHALIVVRPKVFFDQQISIFQL
jgi:hypothetical protein